MRVVEEAERRKGASSPKRGGEVVRTEGKGSGDGGLELEEDGREGRMTVRGRRGPLEGRVFGRE